jgi:hypothetical protein
VNQSPNRPRNRGNFSSRSGYCGYWQTPLPWQTPLQQSALLPQPLLPDGMQPQ